jgi:hypothetical protein
MSNEVTKCQLTVKNRYIQTNVSVVTLSFLVKELV